MVCDVVIICYVMICCVVLRYVMLCYVVLCSVVLGGGRKEEGEGGGADTTITKREPTIGVVGKKYFIESFRNSMFFLFFCTFLKIRKI